MEFLGDVFYSPKLFNLYLKLLVQVCGFSASNIKLGVNLFYFSFPSTSKEVVPILNHHPMAVKDRIRTN